MIHEELSGKIIGAGMDVLNELRPGLDEKLYERAMIIELKRRGHSLSIQRAFPVFYRGELIGNLIPDLIVDDAVIVDPKVAACFTDTHLVSCPGNRMTIAVDDLVILQGASEAPISASISAKRATQENRQSATARKGWVENGLAAAFRLAYSPMKGMRSRRALPAAHFEPNNRHPISGIGH